MSTESDRIQTFYTAFQRRDGEAMSACYTPDAHFRDPAFDLRGERIGAMWRMLCERGKDLRLEFSHVQAMHDSGSADWQAWYTFSATGRSVHNIIHSEFRFRDGLICEQVDTFDFWRWSRQALGPAGLLLGWSSLLQRKVQAQALKGLESFLAKR